MGSMGRWKACSFGDAISLLLLIYTKDTQHDAAAVGLLPCGVKAAALQVYSWAGAMTSSISCPSKSKCFHQMMKYR